jgi:hypothetical protein
VTVVKLGRLCFIVHGFCHAELARGKGEFGGRTRRYLERERVAAGRWWKAMEAMGENEALAIIPWPNDGKGPAADFQREAVELLGDRCFVLDAPLWDHKAFWGEGQPDREREMVRELSSAFLGQGHAWNVEELETGLHSLNVGFQLKQLMGDRGYSLSSSTHADGWGAAFEGCVMKYCGNLTRLLDLQRPIEVEYEMSVPDADFILEVDRWERMTLDGGLRCFLFVAGGRFYGLLASSVQSVGHPAMVAEVALDPKTTRVIDKFGARLWPEPCEEGLPPSELGYREPLQRLVEESDVGLRIPVNGGFVYRRAKAPAYVLPEKGMGWEEFRSVMCGARSRIRPPPGLF